MPAECPVCCQTYEPEPGFYFGATYMNLGFSTSILLITSFKLNYFAHDPPLWVYVATGMATVLVVTPLLFHYSRAVTLGGFGRAHFEPSYLSRQVAGGYFNLECCFRAAFFLGVEFARPRS